MAFILENLGTFVVSLILLLIIAGILVSFIRNKKRGKHSCSGCGSCPSAGMCHKK